MLIHAVALTASLLLAVDTRKEDTRGKSLRDLQAGSREGNDIVGVYLCEGDGPDGKKYKGLVEIVKAGDAYAITWAIGSGEAAIGMGIRKGGFLAASCATRTPQGVGVTTVLYEIQAGPKLVGQFTEVGGKG